MIEEFIEEICDILDIDIPEIEYKDFLGSDTMLAACTEDRDTIFIKNTLNPSPDLYFAIAHELRHMWQFLVDYDYYFGDYKQSNECPNLEIYNMQPAELDAHAFATIVLEDFFNLTPQFNGMSEKVKEQIFKRVDEIANDFE